MAWGRGTARRGARAPLAAVAAVLAVLVAALMLPAASAAFSATTTNPANTLSADRLLPPSGLGASQTCSAPPIAFRARTTATGSNSLTLPVPAGTQPGDVLLAQVAHTYTTATLTPPGGWTLVRSDTVASAVTSRLYWKTATAGEAAATFAFLSGSGIRMSGGAAAYSGVSTTAPVDGHDGFGGNGKVATTPSVTTTTANTMVVRFVANATEAYPAAVGTTERWSFAAGSPIPGVTAADEPFVGPGATGSRSSNSPSNLAGNGVGQTVALRLAPGTPSADLSWAASPSSWATGYRLERSVGGILQSSRTVGTTSTTDGSLVNGTTYTWTLQARHGAWTSTPVTAGLTPSC